ncbi:MAG TPA: HAMP domain-containing sensor histidine kinase [Vicinamibacterales bacterium]|nr:HAMP domain-containing sensor histidine kinase [Vicinamibacterales bacterium]
MTVGLGQGRRISAVSILVGIVLLLVPALAWMQYRWLGQLSEAERERMQRTLRTAAAQFATDFDTELARTLGGLQVESAQLRDENWAAYAQRYTVWTNSVSVPQLVRDVWLVDTLPGTVLPTLDGDRKLSVDRLRLRRWNTQAMTFEAAAWPADLAGMRDQLSTRFVGLEVEQRNRRTELPGVHGEASVTLAVGDDYTLVAPITLFELPEERPGPPRIAIIGFTIVRLSPEVVRDSMLPALMARHFHDEDGAVEYRVAVAHRDDAAKVVWESEPQAMKLVAASPDVTQPFMRPRPEQMFIFARGRDAVVRMTTSASAREHSGELRRDLAEAASGREGGPPPPPPPSPGPDENREPGSGINPRIPDPGSRVPGKDGIWTETVGKMIKADNNVVVQMVERGTPGSRLMPRGGTLDGRWVLLAKHRAGSLEAAVGAVRRRNLAISSGVLMLLTLAVGLIVVSARRAQSLARQQMEFVAAVSHELRTPVSVIGAAAGNLADGVVGDPQRVKKYGETIQGEARRLAETVERVLQLAGIAAGRAAAARLPVSPAELTHDSIAACRPEIDAAGFTVEMAIADDLPNVGGDVTALRSALQNLISNAVKYGGHARWMRVSARLDPGIGTREQVLFSVEDRGLGIDAEDKKHIFEPFYRGREAVSQQIQGSGLGLNLVHRIAEAHGGTVSVVSDPGKGSTFTLSLPAVHDRPVPAAIRPLAADVGD